MSQIDLESRLDRMESIHEVNQLVARYALAADKRNSAKLMAPLFEVGIVWEATGFGLYRGKPAVLEHLALIGAEQIVWSQHYMIAPVITLDMDREVGTCQWYLWELAQVVEDGRNSPAWICGWYDSKVVRAAGQWLFQHVVLDVRLLHRTADIWSPSVSAPS